MHIVKVVIRQLMLPQKTPFRLSYRVSSYKNPLLVEVHDEEGIVGYGECNVTDGPYFSGETIGSAFHLLKHFLIPELFKGDVPSPEIFFDRTQWIRRNRKARGAVDMALWNLYAKEQGKAEAVLLGKYRERVPGGRSLGIQENPDALVRKVEKALDEGYRRIKVKIKPGYDIAYLAAVRKEFGNIPLSCDANGAYTLNDAALLKELDDFHMTMIEQPLGYDDIVDHSHLQAILKTPICLDESVESLEDARKALSLGSCRTINIKLSRVGGMTEARRIQNMAKEKGLRVWCGSTFETGIGAGHNIAAASMENYGYDSDIMNSLDLFKEEDLITRPVTMETDGTFIVPDRPGSGFEPIPERLESHTTEKWEFLRSDFEK